MLSNADEKEGIDKGDEGFLITESTQLDAAVLTLNKYKCRLSSTDS